MADTKSAAKNQSFTFARRHLISPQRLVQKAAGQSFQGTESFVSAHIHRNGAACAYFFEPPAAMTSTLVAEYSGRSESVPAYNAPLLYLRL
jgi:hypothetical protein